MAESPTTAASGTLTPVIASRTVSDAVTNSTTTVTSATAAFVAGDVGRRVTGSADLGSFNYIASVTNGTTIVLAVAASAGHSAQTLNLTSEYVFNAAGAAPFAANKGAGVFQMAFDKTNLASGDVAEYRLYRMLKATGTPRVAYFERFVEAQAADDISCEGPVVGTSLTDFFALVWTITQTKGTARAFDWLLLQY